MLTPTSTRAVVHSQLDTMSYSPLYQALTAGHLGSRLKGTVGYNSFSLPPPWKEFLGSRAS